MKRIKSLWELLIGEMVTEASVTEASEEKRRKFLAQDQAFIGQTLISIVRK